jgi:hypothetical protein
MFFIKFREDVINNYIGGTSIIMNFSVQANLHGHPKYGTYCDALKDFIYVPTSSKVYECLKEKQSLLFSLKSPLTQME